MATRPQSPDAEARTEILLRDAEEALQREKLQALWRQWGSTLIGMCLMLVIGTAAGVAWREWREGRNERSTAALLGVMGNPQADIAQSTVSEMGENHAAIAYLTRAGAVTDLGTPKARENLARLYGAAADAGDGTVWGWLARWNTLRLRMDAESEDPAKLLKDYEDLADDIGDSGLASLAWTDAAIIAGERMKDPAKALDYVASAEKFVPRTSPMAAIIADLRHLYEVRAQSMKEESRPKEEPQAESPQ